MSDRERRLDVIRKTSDRLMGLARQYDQLRWMAEKESTSDAFIVLAETAGKMTEANLQQLAALLELMFTAQFKHEQETP